MPENEIYNTLKQILHDYEIAMQTSKHNTKLKSNSCAKGTQILILASFAK